MCTKVFFIELFIKKINTSKYNVVILNNLNCMNVLFML